MTTATRYATNPNVLPKFSVLIRDPQQRPLATVYGDTEGQAWEAACEMAALVSSGLGRGIQYARDLSCITLYTLPFLGGR